MKTNWIYMILSLTLLGLIVSCGKDTLNDEKVVARVGSEVLMLDDIIQRVPDGMQKKITLDQIKGFVDHWVNTQLVYQQAYRLGLHNTLNDELQQELKKFEIEFLANKLVEREINRKIKVTEEEISAYYEKNKEQFTRLTTEIRAFHLLTSSQENSNQIQQELRKGSNLEALVESYGEPNSLWPNGDLGYFPEEVLPENIQRGIARLKKGETSRPIQSDFGYHFFHIFDRQSKGSIKALDQVHQQIEEKLKVEKRNEAYRAYLVKLKTRANEQNSLSLNYEVLKEFQKDTTHIIFN